MNDRLVAAIDLGSTSVKMLLADPRRRLERTTVVTRLGRGVDATGRFDPAAIATTLDALRRFAAILAEHGDVPLRVVGTSACRDAADREQFFDQVETILGVRPELLSGDEEGRLGYRGALRGLGSPDGAGDRPDALAAPVVVVDIGGGSTELIVEVGGELLVRSIDVGAGRLTERELHDDPPRPEQLANAIGLVHDHLDDIVREIPAVAEAGTLVGVGGTVRVAAAVELGLRDGDTAVLHGFRFDRDAVEDVFRTLATESLADRVHNPGLPADRAPVIVGGCCVLVAVLRRLHLPQLIVSNGGVLDALTGELLEATQ